VCAGTAGGSMAVAGRARARRSEAIAERSIHRFFERSELILSLAAKWGEGAAPGRLAGRSEPPAPAR
jgi:hypothetical protein